MIELLASEGMRGGPSEVCSSGIMIDEETKSTLPGLLAAGDCADQMRCTHICTTGGYLAGKVAAECSRELKTKSVTLSQVKGLKERPSRRSGPRGRSLTASLRTRCERCSGFMQARRGTSIP
jgi:succinate dehydrogenase/fumarate reductase flavoprotein subunit